MTSFSVQLCVMSPKTGNPFFIGDVTDHKQRHDNNLEPVNRCGKGS